MLGLQAQNQFTAHDKASRELGAKTVAIQDGSRSNQGVQIDNLYEAEAVCVHYVMSEIKRDVFENPRRKEYIYPTVYSATPAYEDVLNDVAADWNREVQVCNV